MVSMEGNTDGDQQGNYRRRTKIGREIRAMYLGWNQMVGRDEMKHKTKLKNLLPQISNYFGIEGNTGGDRWGQCIDRDEKRHYLHLKSNGRERRNWEIRKSPQRLGHSLGLKWNESEGRNRERWKTPLFEMKCRIE